MQKIDIRYSNKSVLPLKSMASAILIIAVIFGYVLPSHAQLNCQSEIRLPAKNNPKDKFKKGYCFIKLGQYQEGVSRLIGVENELPLVADYVIYYQGAGYENLGDLSNAATSFNRILTQYPNSALRKKTLARLGNIYTQDGNYTNAERIFTSLYSEEKKSYLKAEYLFSLAEALEKQGKYSEAINTYKKLWVEHPESKYSARAYKAAELISQTHSIAFQVRQSDYLLRANILYKRSHWSAAINSYQKLGSRSTDTNTKMAVAMFKVRRFNEAQKILRNIQTPESLFWRAKIKTKEGLDSRASEIYYQIHTLYPASALAPEGMYNAARLYQINNNTQKAIRIYDELVRKYPRNKYAEDGAWYLGWIYYRKGMYREAHGTFSAFTESDSTFNASNAKYWKARTLEKQGRQSEATAQYKALALQITPTYHSYLAQKKTGHSPTYSNINPNSVALSSSAGAIKNKAMLLIELGMLEDARLEIIKMEQNANTKEELVIVSLLYSKVGDFNNSINTAQNIGLLQANVLSFPRGYKDIVVPYAKRYGVDELLVYSIIREESRFQKHVVSPANAVGLMQLIPPTAKTVARQIGINGFTTDMLTIPRVNIEMGIFYFKQVLDKFNGDVELALASYNAGPHRAADWKVRFYGLDKDEFIEEIPFRETRNYIRRILRSYGAYKAIYGTANSGGGPGTTTPEERRTKYPVN